MPKHTLLAAQTEIDIGFSLPGNGCLYTQKVVVHTRKLRADLICNIHRGKQFMNIQVTMSYIRSVDMHQNIAREMGQNFPETDLKTTVAIQPGQSYFRIAGEEWDDIYRPNSNGVKGNLCIKAFTKNREAPPAGATADIPETGDNAPLALWLAMILLGTLCLGALVLRRSR